MAKPHPRVGEHQQVVDGGAAMPRHAQVEAADQLQRAVVMAPGELQAVVAPAARDLRHQFLLARPVESPFMGRGHFLEQVEGVGGRGAGLVSPALHRAVHAFRIGLASDRNALDPSILGSNPNRHAIRRVQKRDSAPQEKYPAAWKTPGAEPSRR
jgi:hypothetical protein